ncbi:hypothetical protein ABEB36_014859 [Hypothenemus hampei]|uniref:Uncharacterized protein n=1 Tax=Hypothenemus hampei TaxID=57062 RepID=A0ABD1E1D8_HYPHA
MRSKVKANDFHSEEQIYRVPVLAYTSETTKWTKNDIENHKLRHEPLSVSIESTIQTFPTLPRYKGGRSLIDVGSFTPLYLSHPKDSVNRHDTDMSWRTDSRQIWKGKALQGRH